MMQKDSWKKAIIRVLRESATPLHYGEITDQILARGYHSTDGATPRATVNAQNAASIKHEGEKSPFVRVEKGVFALRQARSIGASEEMGSSESHIPIKHLVLAGSDMASSQDSPDTVIRCFGMYWQRESVVWKSDPKLFGKQQLLAKAVDFGKQRGIYILYDHHTVVYVGRAIDRALGKRLYEHTLDRLSGRWNRFSWFGLLEVTQEGSLRELSFRATLASLVGTLEALLIAALEPPQNRKRGDDFSAVEYIQEVDPELKERQIQNTLRAIEQKLRID